MDLSYRTFQEDSDWQGVQSLLAKVPMSSGFPLAAQRTATYKHSFPQIQGETHDHVCFTKGQIVGFMHSSLARRRIAGREVPIAYLGDGRMHPDFRRHGIASAILQSAIKNYRHRGIELGYFLTLDNNAHVHRFLESNHLLMRKVASYVATSLFVFGRKAHKESKVFEEFVPRTQDFADLLQEWESQELSPLADVEHLEKFFWEYPEIRVFRERDSRQWAFALWNQRAFRRLSFTRSNRLLRTMRPFWNTLAAFGMATSFPTTGEPWSSIEVCFTTSRMNHPDLKKFLVQEGRRENAHTVNLVESGLSQAPLTSRHWAEYRMNLGYYLCSFNEKFPSWVPEAFKPSIYLDLGFV